MLLFFYFSQFESQYPFNNWSLIQTVCFFYVSSVENREPYQQDFLSRKFHLETINYVEITVDFPILRVLYTEIVVMISLFEIILIKVLLFIIEIKLIIIMRLISRGPSLEFRDIFFTTKPFLVHSKEQYIIRYFWEGGRGLGPGKFFMTKIVTP